MSRKLAGFGPEERAALAALYGPSDPPSAPSAPVAVQDDPMVVPPRQTIDDIEYARERRRLSTQAAREMDRGSVKAARKLVNLVDSEADSVALKACTEVLDRTIGKAVQVIEQNVRHDVEAIHLSDAELIARLEAQGVPVPTRLRRIIDVEPELSANDDAS